MRIILASESPFRKHALDLLGLQYETIPSQIDESLIVHNDLYVRAEMLSQAKAKKVGELHGDAIIIAADLFVIHDGKIFEKPKDMVEAKEMLASFSGTALEIVTGFAVYNSGTQKLLSSFDVCRVLFRTLNNFEINDYITRYPVLKCAAGFEADGLLRFAEHIEGSYNFKAALPVNRLIEFLRENEVAV